MTLYFLDVNVWVALAVASHLHGKDAWRWLKLVPNEDRLVMTRFAQIGILRLLTSPSVMGDQILTLRKAWDAYDRLIRDPRVEFYPEPRCIEVVFRRITEMFGTQSASKAVGDCWLLAHAVELTATMVTFDRGLIDLARRLGQPAILPS